MSVRHKKKFASPNRRRMDEIRWLHQKRLDKLRAELPAMSTFATRAGGKYSPNACAVARRTGDHENLQRMYRGGEL